MTVPATSQVAGPFNGNGVTTAFPFTFKTFNPAHLRVVRAVSGVETTLVLNSDYTVALNPNQDAAPGGTITFPISGSPLAIGSTLTIEGAVPLGQSTDLPDGGSFNASTVETALDVLALQNLQQQDQINRALQLPVSAPAGVSGVLPTPVANQFIGWDAEATSLRNIDPTTLATIVATANWRTDVFSGNGSTIAFTLTADPGNVNNMDVSISGVTQVPVDDYSVSGTTLTFVAPPPAGTRNVMVRYGQSLPQGTVDASSINVTNAGAGAVVRTLTTKLGDVLSLQDFGGNGNGIADNYTPFVNALAAASAQQRPLYVPPGTYNIASASLGSNGLSIPAGVSIIGVPDATRLVVTGTTQCNLFRFDNASNIGLYGLVMRGNNQAADSANGSALYARQTTGASAVMQGITVDRCRLENFRGDYWLRFESLNTTHALRHIRVQDCVFVSETGNARGPTNIGIPSGCVQFYGPEAGSVHIEDVLVSNCTADIPHIKNFLIVWQGCRRVRATNNTIRNCGTDAAIVNDGGAYAFLVYWLSTGGPRPDRIEIVDNLVDGVRSCGVYAVQPLRLLVDGLECYNQTDTVDATLPKGAVAINFGAQVTIRNVRGWECIRGVQVVSEGGGEYTLSDIEVHSTSANAIGVDITSGAGAQAGSIDIDGLVLDLRTGAGSFGVNVRWGSTFAADRFTLRNFRVFATGTALRFLRSDGTTPASRWMHVANGVVAGATDYGIRFENWTNSNQRAVFENIQFAGGWGVAAYQAGFTLSTNFVARNFTFCDEPASATGTAWDGSGAQGSIEGFRYINCPTLGYRALVTGLEDLGRDTPTWAATQGTFVQIVVPSSTIKLGWSRDGAAAWNAT